MDQDQCSFHCHGLGSYLPWWSSINISIEYKYDHSNISIWLWKFANNAFTDTPTPHTEHHQFRKQSEAAPWVIKNLPPSYPTTTLVSSRSRWTLILQHHKSRHFVCSGAGREGFSVMRNAMARHLCQSATKLIKSASGSAGGAARLMKCSQSQRCEVNRNPWTERIAAQQGSSCLSGREES